MESILGIIPEFPLTFIPSLIDKCRQKDIDESLYGNEESPYTNQVRQEYEYTFKEIGEALGLEWRTVEKILYRANDKLVRRLFIMTMMDRMPEEEICDILNSGIENVRKKISWMFLS